MVDPELALLQQAKTAGLETQSQTATAPLITKDAMNILQWRNPFPQRALLGSVLNQYHEGSVSSTKDPQLYLNLDTPSSGLVCGVQYVVCRFTSYWGSDTLAVSGQGFGQKPHSVLYFGGRAYQERDYWDITDTVVNSRVRTFHLSAGSTSWSD